jgi:hypothetical protein
MCAQYKASYWPRSFVQAVTSLTCVRNVAGSNRNRYTDHPVWRISWCCSFPEGWCRFIIHKSSCHMTSWSPSSWANLSELSDKIIDRSFFKLSLQHFVTFLTELRWENKSANFLALLCYPPGGCPSFREWKWERCLSLSSGRAQK